MNRPTLPHELSPWQRRIRKLRLFVRLVSSLRSSRADPPKISFAQSCEDLLARQILLSLGIPQPRYFDIGAHHPFDLSNTALFHFLGCHGINVEPDPVLFEAFPRHRPQDLNLNVGVGPVPGEMTFFRMAHPALNTFSADEAHRIAAEEGIPIVGQISVRIETPDAIITRAGYVPDFVSIDTEGHDLTILQSFDFDRHRPAVICVESLTFSTRGQGRKLPEIAAFLESAGYRAHADTHLNTLFVDERRFPGGE